MLIERTSRTRRHREIRLGGVEPVSAADERSRTERRVQLVAGEREVVHTDLGEIDTAVGHELRTVDEDPGAGSVCELGEFGDRQDLTGDVGSTGDGEQGRGGALEFDREAPHRLGDGVRGLDDARILPGQQIRVMLDVEHDDIAGHRTREQVQRIGGVAREDDDLVVGRADEARDGRAGVLVGGGADPRGVSGTAVHARVEGQQLRDAVGDGGQRRCARRVVEVRVGAGTTLDERNLHVTAGNGGERSDAGGGGHSSHDKSLVYSGTRR